MSRLLGADLWEELCRGIGVPTAAARDMHAELVERYSEPHRHYHNVTHIESMLELLAHREESLDSPASVYLATFFHDAIYNPAAPDNEDQSAQLASDWLSGQNVDARITQAVVELIEATANHMEAEGSGDLAWFLDADLSILGSETSRYDDYAAAIRREYSFVTDADYRTGRTSVLNQFLNSDRVFRTPGLYDELECRARDNLRREHEALTA